MSRNIAKRLNFHLRSRKATQLHEFSTSK